MTADFRQQLLEILAERERAKSTLAGFAEYMLDVKPALHHKMLCDAIDGLLDDEYDELIINTPPGSAKSTYSSVALPAYFFGRWPGKMVLAASYSADLADKWGRKVRNTVADDKYYKLFEVGLSQDSKSAGRWATNRGGEYFAAGVGAGILGFRADLGILDDPVSGFEEAQSMSRLKKLHDWYETEFMTRLKPGAKVVLICQRLSKNDLAGYLIERNRLEPTRRQRILVMRMEAGEDDLLGRQPGERLWPEWFTQAMVTDAKRDDFKWRTLYQQEPPSDTGSWVALNEIKIVQVVPDNLSFYILTDLALSVNSGDYSVHLAVGVDNNQNVYIVDAWRDRCAPDKTVDKHLEFVQTYSPYESLIDDDNAAKVYIQLLARSARDGGVPVPYHMMPMRGQNKETRAAPLRGWFKRGKMFMHEADWNNWLIKELVQFPNATGSGVDDGVDALTLIGRRLAMLAVKNIDPPKRAEPIAVKLPTLNELWELNDKQAGSRKRI